MFSLIYWKHISIQLNPVKYNQSAFTLITNTSLAVHCIYSFFHYDYTKMPQYSGEGEKSAFSIHNADIVYLCFERIMI